MNLAIRYDGGRRADHHDGRGVFLVGVMFGEAGGGQKGAKGRSFWEKKASSRLKIESWNF